MRGGLVSGTQCGAGIRWAGIVRAGCGGRHRGVVDRAERAGAKAAAWETKPDDRSVCDELQNARAAKFSVGDGRSNSERFQRKEPGGKLRRRQRRRESPSGQRDREWDAGELLDRAATDSRLPCFQWPRTSGAGIASRTKPRRAAVEKFRGAIGGRVEEKSHPDGDRPGQSLQLSNGNALPRQLAAARLSRVRKGCA